MTSSHAENLRNIQSVENFANFLPLVSYTSVHGWKNFSPKAGVFVVCIRVSGPDCLDVQCVTPANLAESPRFLFSLPAGVWQLWLFSIKLRVLWESQSGGTCQSSTTTVQHLWKHPVVSGCVWICFFWIFVSFWSSTETTHNWMSSLRKGQR